MFYAGIYARFPLGLKRALLKASAPVDKLPDKLGLPLQSLLGWVMGRDKYMSFSMVKNRAVYAHFKGGGGGFTTEILENTISR